MLAFPTLAVLAVNDGNWLLRSGAIGARKHRHGVGLAVAAAEGSVLRALVSAIGLVSIEKATHRMIVGFFAGLSVCVADSGYIVTVFGTFSIGLLVGVEA